MIVCFRKKVSPLGKLVFISLVFLIMFTAFNSIQNLVSEIYEQSGYDNLGRICLFAFNIAFCIGSFSTARIVKKFGISPSIFFATLPYLLASASGILMSACTQTKPAPAYCESPTIVITFHIVAYFVVGLGSAILWNAQSGYITVIAPKDREGSYFGIFFAIIQNSFILGSILPSFVFRMASTMVYFGLMFIVSASASLLCLFLPHPDAENMDGKRNIDDKVAVEETEQQRDEDYISEVKRLLMLRHDPIIKPWILMMMLAGVAHTYSTGFLYRFVGLSLPSTATNVEIIGATSDLFIVFGIGMVISALIIGPCIDRFGTTVMTLVVLTSFGVMLALSGWELVKRDYKLACIIAALCGSADVSIGTLVLSVITIDLGGSLDYFALYRVVQVLASSLAYIVLIILNEFNPIVIIISMVLSFVFVCLSLLHLAKRPVKDEASYPGIPEIESASPQPLLKHKEC